MGITSLALCAVFLASTVSPLLVPRAQAEEPYRAELTPPRTAIPTTYFGMHVLHLIDNKDTDWPTIPFGTWRLWDAHVSWNLLEPKRGVYDFSLLDRYVEVAKQRNVELILTLAITPPWADGGVHGGIAPPTNLDDWQSFVHTVAARYANKIHYYEIWNEPAHTAWFSGTVQDLYNMTAVAYTAIKTADPTAVVLSPPVNGDPNGLVWLDKFLALGGGKFVDQYAFHLYVGGYPETLVPKYGHVRDVLAKYGEDKKLAWNTEAGWPFYLMTPELGSQYIARAYIINWALGLGRLNIYAWDHPRLGIAPNGVDTDLTHAYKWIAGYLQNGTMTRCVQLKNGVWFADVTEANGSRIRIAWHPNADVVLEPAQVEGATEYATLAGNMVHISDDAKHVHVSRSPIVLMLPDASSRRQPPLYVRTPPNTVR